MFWYGETWASDSTGGVDAAKDAWFVGVACLWRGGRVDGQGPLPDTHRARFENGPRRYASWSPRRKPVQRLALRPRSRRCSTRGSLPRSLGGRKARCARPSRLLVIMSVLVLVGYRSALSPRRRLIRCLLSSAGHRCPLRRWGGYVVSCMRRWLRLFVGIGSGRTRRPTRRVLMLVRVVMSCRILRW